jgi:ATP synthase F1 delta subunit
MSFSKKIVTMYAKSLFENVRSFSTQNLESYDDLKEASKFDISRIVSRIEKQPEDSITVYSVILELSYVTSFIISSQKIRNIFNNPTLPEKRKLEVILDLFPGLSSITRSFLKILTEKTHLSFIPEITEEYNQLLLKFEKSTKVKLILANILEKSYGTVLLNSLKKITESINVFIDISYNPQLLGGLIIEYNSISIDASLLKKFSLFFNEI